MMKAKILVLVLLNVSQAYAWGDKERSALLGFIGGVVVGTVIHNNSVNNNDSTIKGVTYYKELPKRVHKYNYLHKQRKRVVKEVCYNNYSNHNYRGHYKNKHSKRYEGYYR